MAHQGFDSLTVDMQHGVVDYQAAVTMLQAISTTPTIPLARVPAGSHNTTGAYAQKRVNAVFQFVTIASDSRFLAAKASEEVAALRKSGVRTGRLPAY